MINNSPLVSVFIVTYNSSDYIIEALDSIKAQSYHNIEIIVSDDCSTDNTADLVKDWFLSNSNRFIRTELVETPINMGIPANYNRAVNASRGEWLKMMDGDDLLVDTCIKDNMNYIHNHPEAKVIFSDMYRFHGTDVRNETVRQFKPHMKEFFKHSSNEQLQILLKGNFLPSQTCFISADLLKQHKYNESYRLLEDYPMWIKLLCNGVRFSYFDKCTARYRISDSVSSSRKVLFPAYYTSITRVFFWNEVYPLTKETNNNKAYNRQRCYFFWCDLCEIFLRNCSNFITRPLSFLLKLLVFGLIRFKL